MFVYKYRKVYGRNVNKLSGAQTVLIYSCHNTGLPAKEETSETTIQNSHALFPDIYGSLQL